MKTMRRNATSAIRSRSGAFAGASKMNDTISPAAPRYAIPASAFSSSFFVSESNSNIPAARAATAITTNIQIVSGTHQGRMIDAIRIGRAMAAVSSRVFITQNHLRKRVVGTCKQLKPLRTPAPAKRHLLVQTLTLSSTPRHPLTQVVLTVQSAEPPTPFLELDDRLEHVPAAEVGEQGGGDVDLAVRELPEQEIGDAHFAAGADHQVHVRQAVGVQVAFDVCLGQVIDHVAASFDVGEGEA